MFNIGFIYSKISIRLSNKYHNSSYLHLNSVQRQLHIPWATLYVKGNSDVLSEVCWWFHHTELNAKYLIHFLVSSSTVALKGKEKNYWNSEGKLENIWHPVTFKYTCYFVVKPLKIFRRMTESNTLYNGSFVGYMKVSFKTDKRASNLRS